MNQAEQYIEAYKKLEETVRMVYQLRDGDSISVCLRSKKEFRKDAEEIRYCQDVRNLLQHRRKISGGYPVQPSVEMIRFVKELTERVEGRKHCMDIAVPFSGLYWRDERRSVLETVMDMKNHSYTQVPILHNRRVTGVFDQTSLFLFLTESGMDSLTEDVTFADIRDYCRLNKKRTEIFTFQPKSQYVDELEDVFEQQYQRGKRIAAAFLTETGSIQEPILGMITPWDILGKTES